MTFYALYGSKKEIQLKIDSYNNYLYICNQSE